MNMTSFSLLAASFFIKIMAVIFVICAAILTLVILLQKGRGGGLSAAFAGGVASGILGSKTGDFLTWVTIVLVSVFLVLAVVLAKFYRPSLTAEFDTGQPARQTQPVDSTGSPQVEQPPGNVEQPTEQPAEQVPSAAPGSDANSSGDSQDLPGG
jgi:preprotein translocase subunit SecG